jgi:hypothetical protein
VTILNRFKAKDIIRFVDLIEIFVGDDSFTLSDRYGNKESYEIDFEDREKINDVLNYILLKKPGTCRVIDRRNIKKFDLNKINPLSFPTISKEEIEHTKDILLRKDGSQRHMTIALTFLGFSIMAFPLLSIIYGYNSTLVWISIVMSTKLVFLSLMLALNRWSTRNEAYRIVEWALVQQEKRKIKILPDLDRNEQSIIMKRMNAKKRQAENGYSLAKDKRFDVGISIFLGIGFFIILISSFVVGFIIFFMGYGPEWFFISLGVVLFVLTVVLFFVAWIAGSIRKKYMLKKLKTDRIP